MNEKDLLDVARSAVSTPIKEFNKHIHREVLRFVREFSITDGSEPITTMSLYYAYHIWTTNPPISRHKFTYNIAMMFPVTKKGRYRFIHIQNFPHHLVNIPKEKQEEFSRKCFKKRQHAKKRKKKENKISGTTS